MLRSRWGWHCKDWFGNIDPELPVHDLRSMDDRIADSLVAQRSPAWIGGIFSLIAVLLIAVGTYGVLSYAVAQRRREIGVRMALGARPDQIRGQFLALALRLLAGGTILGSIGAWLAGRAMRTMLFQVAIPSAGDSCRCRRGNRRRLPRRLPAALTPRRADLPYGSPGRSVAEPGGRRSCLPPASRALLE